MTESEQLKLDYHDILNKIEYYRGFNNLENNKVKALKGRLNIILQLAKSRKINTLSWRKLKWA